MRRLLFLSLFFLAPTATIQAEPIAPEIEAAQPTRFIAPPQFEQSKLDRIKLNVSQDAGLRFNWTSELTGNAPRLQVPRKTEHSTHLTLMIDNADRRDQGTREGWYVFAGADNEAITMQALTAGDIELREHVTVGDLHIGVAFPVLGGHGTLGYASREIEFQDRVTSISMNEDIIGMSFGQRF